MQRRAFERIPVYIEVKLFCGFMFFSGVITNLSENGMLINTRICLPFESRFEVLIPIKEEVLKVHCKVTRIVNTGDLYDAMGVELLNPPKKYFEFVYSLKSVCKP